MVMDMATMEKLLRFAEIMASGKSTVPVHLRNSVGDCMAVSMQATQWGMNPFAVAQKTHVVNGTLGYEAQLVAAVINSSGVVSDRFHFEWFGKWEKIVGRFKEVTSTTKKDDNGLAKKFIVPAWEQADEVGLGVRVWATIRGESEPRVLEILMTQARTRNSTLWAEDPKQQLAYLAQKRWARLYTPDVILGVYTRDELDAPPAPKDMGGVEEVTATSKTAGLTNDQLETWKCEAAKGVAAATAHWKAMGPDARKQATESQKTEMMDIAKSADQSRTVDTPLANQHKPAAAAKSFEDVMTMLCAAATEDALYVAGDWIEDFKGEEKTFLSQKFDEQLATVRRAEA